MQEIVEHYGIAYQYMPVNKKNKNIQEKELLSLIKKYKIDPALATGPFITTVNDVLGLFIYFMIGQMILS